MAACADSRFRPARSPGAERIEHDDQVNVVNRPDMGTAGQATRRYDVNDVRKLLQLPDEIIPPPLGQQHTDRITFDRPPDLAEGITPVPLLLRSHEARMLWAGSPKTRVSLSPGQVIVASAWHRVAGAQNINSAQYSLCKSCVSRPPSTERTNTCAGK